MMERRLEVSKRPQFGAIQKRVGHGGDQRHAGGLFFLDQAQHLRGIEAPHHHMPQTHEGAGLRPAPAVGVEERDGVQFNAGVVVTERGGDV